MSKLLSSALGKVKVFHSQQGTGMKSLHTGKKALEAIRAANADVNLLGTNSLIIGGTSGIGEGIAKRLAKAKVSVTIAGRNEKRGEEIVQELYQLSGGDNDKIQHKFVSCDTSTMKRIRSFCGQVETNMNSNGKVLDYLVLSQGIGSMKGRTETSEGIDEKLQLHYFGRMYFIECLLPLLRQSKDGARVMSILSGGVHSPYDKYKEDFELKTNFTLPNAANAAGMYNDLCLGAFAEQPNNEKISFFHAAPGVVNTKADRNLPGPLKMLGSLLKPLLAKSIDDCGEIMANSLIGNLNGKAGLFLVDEHGNPAKSMKLANEKEAKDFVWKATHQVFQEALSKNKSN